MTADLTLLAAEIGQRIRTLRIAAGLRQEELAAAIGRSRSTVANMEAGKQGDVPVTVLVALAQALHTTVAVLIGERPMPELPPACEVEQVWSVRCATCGPVAQADSHQEGRALRVRHLEGQHAWSGVRS